MRYFNKEEMKALAELESFFETTVKYGFKHNTTRAQNELAKSVYEAAGGRLNNNWACSRCAFEDYKKIGLWYYESKKHQGGRPAKKKE